jgi:transcriptional antiterminator NusG
MADKQTKETAAADSQKETQTTNKKAPENHLVITKSDDPRAKWYVVHTYSGHEARVMASLRQRVETMHLADRILEILIPTQEQIQIRGGKKHQVTEKIFPGYILVRMILDDNSWLAVRTTQGVTGFVGVGNKPTPISDEEVATIQKFMSLEAPKYRAKFSVSEAVKIVDGPFSEFLGSIESIDEARGKVRVLVSIFGRETPVELDFLQVKKL